MKKKKSISKTGSPQQPKSIPIPKSLLSISGVIWADDHTDVYIGNCEEITSKKIATQNYPNPVEFVYEKVNCCDYLYFVCWSNDLGLNGFLAQINGDNQVLTGSNDWKVFATGRDYDRPNSRPSTKVINEELKRACKLGWETPFEGQPNNGSGKPWGDVKSGISQNALFVWDNSGKDGRSLYPASPYVPFAGFNHDELLIFRLPISSLFKERCTNTECEECDCSCNDCDGCNENAKTQDKELVQRAMRKQNTLQPVHPNAGHVSNPFQVRNCRNVVNPGTNLRPSIYLHWGDSAGDVIENHDTEILYITVCNPFEDVEFKGFKITNVNLNPQPTQLHQARIIPDKFVEYGCLKPCTCKTREFTLITRDELNAYTGTKHIQVEYCLEGVVITKNIDTRNVDLFEINIVKDE